MGLVAGVFGAGFGVWAYLATDTQKDVAAVVDPATEKLRSENAKIQAAIEKARIDILNDNERSRQLPSPSVVQQQISTPARGLPEVKQALSPLNGVHNGDAAVVSSGDKFSTSVGRKPQIDTISSHKRIFTFNTPTTIVAPEGEALYQDKIAAASLSELLSKSLRAAEDGDTMFLRIEISRVDIRKTITGQPCPDTNESAYSGFSAYATITIRMVWSDGSIELPAQPFSDVRPTCDASESDVTRNSAFIHAIGAARNKILSLAHAPETNH